LPIAQFYVAYSAQATAKLYPGEKPHRKIEDPQGSLRILTDLGKNF